MATARVMAFLAGICGISLAVAQTPAWKELETGLWHGEFLAPKPSEATIVIIKADPRKNHLKLLSTSELQCNPMTTKEWCTKHHLVVATNAGMYLKDNRTSVGYFRNLDHVNNKRYNSYNSIIAFNPADSSTPPFMLIDRTCDDVSLLSTAFHSIVQNLRIVDCHRNIVWARQERKHSMVIIGEDSAGCVLLIFTRTPLAVHNFAEILLDLPLSIKRLAYLEGGPVASLHISHELLESDHNGLIEGGLFDGEESSPWELPLIIGISARTD
jgi:hypothetical protein